MDISPDFLPLMIFYRKRERKLKLLLLNFFCRTGRTFKKSPSFHYSHQVEIRLSIPIIWPCSRKVALRSSRPPASQPILPHTPSSIMLEFSTRARSFSAHQRAPRVRGDGAVKMTKLFNKKAQEIISPSQCCNSRMHR